MKFRVEFEFKNNDLEVSDGKFHKDYLDNNGAGFSYEDACDVARELHLTSVTDNRNIKIVEIESQEREDK